MTAITMGRIGVPYLAIAAACGAAVALGIIQVRHYAMPEPQAAPPPAVTSAPAPPVQDPMSHALAALQDQATAVAPAAPSPSPAPQADERMPAFDVARIEETGEAVIAGRAAPGATVELMRDGESLDRAVADSSGLFVMTPARLPAGSYALTLRSKDASGKETRSTQSVAVALAERAPVSGTLQAHAVLPSRTADASGAVTFSPAAVDPASPSTARPSQPALQPAKDTAALNTAAPSDGSALSAALPPKKFTATVARGDSLWRISRMTYGEGTHYSLVFRANRDRIRNPDRIYPGQVFVLPLKEH